MNRNSNRTDWFFPIEEAPVFTTVTRSGESLNVRVPHKKALIAADTGDIFSSNTMPDNCLPPAAESALPPRPPHP